MRIDHKKIFSWKIKISLLFCVIFFIVSALFFVKRRIYTIDVFYAENSTLTALASKTGFSASTPIMKQPVRILIPAIGVNAAIESVGLSPLGDGDMDVPISLMNVAWYNKGPFPGMAGSAVIGGHLNGKNFSRGVFYNIGVLKIGDLIEIVDRSEKKIQFHVVNIKTYDYKDSTKDIFLSDSSKARLNLITCAGDWIKNRKTYDKRTVVFAEFVKTD